MSQQNYYMNKPDVENLENAASVIQREEQKIEGTTRPGGPAAKAKSFADRAADVYDEPKFSTINRPVERNPKPNPQDVDDAARTIQREEAKIYGANLPGGAAATAQSFAAQVHKEADTQ